MATALLRAIRELNNREVLVLPNGALPAHELVAVGEGARDGDARGLHAVHAQVVTGDCAGSSRSSTRKSHARGLKWTV